MPARARNRALPRSVRDPDDQVAAVGGAAVHAHRQREHDIETLLVVGDDEFGIVLAGAAAVLQTDHDGAVLNRVAIAASGRPEVSCQVDFPAEPVGEAAVAPVVPAAELDALAGDVLDRI